MRISDWSSDVCSSDLPALGRLDIGAQLFHTAAEKGVGIGDHVVLQPHLVFDVTLRHGVGDLLRELRVGGGVGDGDHPRRAFDLDGEVPQEAADHPRLARSPAHLVGWQVPGAGRLRLRQLDAAALDRALAQPGDHRLEQALDGGLDVVGDIVFRRRERRIELRQRAEAEAVHHPPGHGRGLDDLDLAFHRLQAHRQSRQHRVELDDLLLARLDDDRRPRRAEGRGPRLDLSVVRGPGQAAPGLAAVWAWMAWTSLSLVARRTGRADGTDSNWTIFCWRCSTMIVALAVESGVATPWAMIAPLRATIMQARTIHLRRQMTPSNCRIDRLMRPAGSRLWVVDWRSEEHTSELQSLMRISYAVFCLKKKKNEQSKRQ